jgi:nucleoid-associated protein YgaU
MSRFIRIAAVFALSLVLVNCPTAPKPPANTVAAPAFSPAEGSYPGAQSVTLATSTEGAEIRYTTDSSAPTATSGTVYAGPIPVGATTTLRAIACKTGWSDSPVVSATFTIAEKTEAAITEPEITEPEITEPEITVAEITDAEIMNARNALARAKEVDADYFDPDNYGAARRLLDEGIELRTADPGSARQRLADSEEKADLAFTNAVARAGEDMAARMEAARKKLLDIEADKFLPADYEKATAGIEEATSLYQDGTYADAKARAYQALKDMTDLRNRLDTRLADVRLLKYDTEQLMKQAEAEEAYTYAPGQKQKVTSLYLKGVEAFKGYNLDDAEENFGAAREAAKETLRIASEARSGGQAEARKKADAMQVRVMKSLQEASKLTVVTEDGTVIKPQNWKEEDFLEEIDRMLQEEQKNAPAGGESMLIPLNGTTAVMADDSTVNLLQQARDLWVQGLKEKAAGNYGKALDFFNEAQRYIDIYKSYAVKGVYAVRLIPERRDCLWRIAEYKEIYGDPYKWPNIWRRNRKLIQNPDLIYPGWQLVIPPD